MISKLAGEPLCIVPMIVLMTTALDTLVNHYSLHGYFSLLLPCDVSSRHPLNSTISTKRHVTNVFIFRWNKNFLKIKKRHNILIQHFASLWFYILLYFQSNTNGNLGICIFCTYSLSSCFHFLPFLLCLTQFGRTIRTIHVACTWWDPEAPWRIFFPTRE